MKIDRQYQKDLLAFLLEDFPSYENAFEHCKKLVDEDSDKYVANVEYLQRHGLLEDGVSIDFAMDGTPYVSVKAFPKITEAGIDFMLDDGGLSAILHVQTVRLHPDTIKSLVEERIRTADLPEEEKSSLIEKIRSLPEEGAKNLLDKLLDKGIDLLVETAPSLLDML